jgi:predicted nucleotidyltransferase
MVVDSETLQNKLKSYVADVKKTIPLDKVYLYGSYAKGTPHEWSDVDVCFFSKAFEGRKSVDITCELMEIAWKYNPDICFEQNAFPTSEIENDNPFVKEVLRTGREINIE